MFNSLRSNKSEVFSRQNSVAYLRLQNIFYALICALEFKDYPMQFPPGDHLISEQQFFAFNLQLYEYNLAC